MPAASEAASVRVLLTEHQLRERIVALAAELDDAYKESSDLVLVGVLRGAIYFLSDLSRAMRTPHRIDFVEYVSYSGTSKGRATSSRSDPTPRSNATPAPGAGSSMRAEPTK